MNIALFASAFYPSLGGVEEFCRQIAHAYQKQGHRVIVFTNRWPRSLPQEDVVEGIAIRRLAFRVAENSLKSKVTAWLTSGQVHRSLSKMLRDFGAEILHVHCVSSNALYATEAHRNTGIPLVVTLHGELSMDATGLFQRQAWAQQTLRSILEEAGRITACSRQTLEEAQAWYGRPFGSRASVIYNGIDFAEMQNASPHVRARPYVLAIGRFVPQKGFSTLLEAMALAIQNPAFDHDLVLAGNGTEDGALRALAAELDLRDRIHFSGRVDHAAATHLFRGCSFFALPSLHEPFGIVNLEAMAAGKAVLATRVGGVPEVVQESQTGLLVPPGDAQSFAAGLLTLANDASLRDRLGEAGRSRAEQFGWAEIASQHLDLYRELVGDKTPEMASFFQTHD